MWNTLCFAASLLSQPDANTFRLEIKTRYFARSFVRSLARSLRDDCAIRRRRRRRRNTSCKWPSHKIEYMCCRRSRRKFLAPATINNGLDYVVCIQCKIHILDSLDASGRHAEIQFRSRSPNFLISFYLSLEMFNIGNLEFGA